jgi:hydroxyacylglutathione hydrolase
MITVSLIPILSDNYAFLLEADDGQVAIVDPGEAGPIIAALEAKDLKPDLIVVTHHHFDHMDGAADMLRWHDCPIVGADRGACPDNPSRSRVDVPFTQVLDAGSAFSFGGEAVQVIEAPGHTPEHLCFYFAQSGFVLAGDVLFVMGCGRMVHGTAEVLYKSLQKLGALPDETVVYCGHEYTLGNATFAAHVQPDNAEIAARLDAVKALRDADTPTVPTTLAEEKRTNVFLNANSAADFAALRELKDSF